MIRYFSRKEPEMIRYLITQEPGDPLHSGGLAGAPERVDQRSQKPGQPTQTAFRNGLDFLQNRPSPRAGNTASRGAGGRPSDDSGGRQERDIAAAEGRKLERRTRRSEASGSRHGRGCG